MTDKTGNTGAVSEDSLLLKNQLCFPLYAASRMVTAAYTPFLKPLGITYTQYLALLVLWEKTSVTVGELGRALYLDNGTLTPMLKKMEQAGLLVRKRDTADERIVVVSLTKKGESLKQKALHIPGKLKSCLPVDHKKAEQLYTILYDILDGTCGHLP